MASRTGKAKFRHLGVNLTMQQEDALLFGLTEGSVGPGARTRYRKVSAKTVQWLTRAGLAGLPSGLGRSPIQFPFTDGWVALTHWGFDVARAIYKSRYGREWDGPRTTR